MLLAIDTSTHFASVALHDGTQPRAEHTWLARQDHTRTLVPAIQAALASAGTHLAQLSGLAVALGPGSFNGLRVGLSTAKGLALAQGLPLVGVGTLELLAAEYSLTEPAMNAGRGRVYVAGQHGAGDIQLREGAAPDRIRHAGVLAELAWQRLRAGQTVDPAKVQPIYVQPPHITPSSKVPNSQIPIPSAVP